MPLDVLASVRSTALVALVTASFTSPIVVKTDAFASASARITGKPVPHAEVPKEQLVAGGVEFALPADWGRLGATAAGGEAGAEERIGTVVTAVCPGGSTGVACKDDVQVTFIAYSGKDGHELPLLTEFEEQLDARLAKQFPGFEKEDAGVKPGVDMIRWLDYRFSWRSGRDTVHQRFAAFRHEDGSGVVAMVSGVPHDKADVKELDEFLASGTPVLDAGSGADH